MPTKAEVEKQRAEDRRRDAWIDEQIADCRARFDLSLAPEEEADIADDLAHDRDGGTHEAAALARREAARQLGGVDWAAVEGRAIVAQIEAWKIIEDAAGRCAPAGASTDAGRKLRFYLHALAIRAEMEGRNPETVVGDAVFHVLAGDCAARELCRRLDESDGEIGLWVGVLLSPQAQAGSGEDRDTAQALRRLRKVAWTYLREWVRKDATDPDARKPHAPELDAELWRRAVIRTEGPTLAGSLASPPNGDGSGPPVDAASGEPPGLTSAGRPLWGLKVTLFGGAGGGLEWRGRRNSSSVS